MTQHTLFARVPTPQKKHLFARVFYGTKKHLFVFFPALDCELYSVNFDRAYYTPGFGVARDFSTHLNLKGITLPKMTIQQIKLLHREFFDSKNCLQGINRRVPPIYTRGMATTSRHQRPVQLLAPPSVWSSP